MFLRSKGRSGMQQLFWMQKVSQSQQQGIMSMPARNFGSMGAIVKADGDHKFIAPVDKKMIAFT